MKKSGIVAGVALVSAVGFALLGGCGGGGGGGGSGKTAKFTAADTQAAVDQFTSAVDGCDQPAKQAVGMVKASSRMLGALSLARMPFARVQDGGTFAGNCTDHADGTLSVLQTDHSNGNTYYDVDFDNYCSRDPASGNETIQNGLGEYMIDGDSTLGGNVYRAEKFSTDSTGIQSVTYDSGLAIVSDTTSVLTGYTRTRGTQIAFDWVSPTLADPDTEKITKLVVTDNIADEKTTFTSLKGSVYDTGGDHVLTVTGGTGNSTVAGTYTVETEAGSPIIFRNKEHVAGGTLLINGSNSTIKITAANGGDNEFTVSVKGSDTAGVFEDIPVECGAVEFGYYFVGIDE